jgi:hypothetical protein
LLIVFDFIIIQLRTLVLAEEEQIRINKKESSQLRVEPGTSRTKTSIMPLDQRARYIQQMCCYVINADVG